MNANPSATRIYILTEVALLGLLALTIAVAHLNLGPFNVMITAAISVASATLIILNFMHIRHCKPLLRIFVAAGFFWLGILFALALSDFMTRGWN